MPVERGLDERGLYFRWGRRGEKYYYKEGDEKSRDDAYAKARKQGEAIFASASR